MQNRKHGVAKVWIKGVDIFTEKIYENIQKKSDCNKLVNPTIKKYILLELCNFNVSSE